MKIHQQHPHITTQHQFDNWQFTIVTMKIRKLLSYLFSLTSILTLGWIYPAQADSRLEISPIEIAAYIPTKVEDLEDTNTQLSSADELNSVGDEDSRISATNPNRINTALISENSPEKIEKETPVAILATKDINSSPVTEKLSALQTDSTTSINVNQAEQATFSATQEISVLDQTQTTAEDSNSTKSIDSAQAKAEEILPQPQPKQLISQAETSTPNSDTPESESELRQRLRITPLLRAGKPTYSPSLSFGIPSAFGANWGDVFVGVSGATAGKARGGDVDGSMSVGLGLGDSRKLVGLELAYNLGSFRNFGSNGTFDLKGHRVVYGNERTQVAVAAGWNAFAQYQSDASSETDIPSSAYGAVTSYSLLQPNNPHNKLPLLLTFGVGGGQFRQGDASTGVFGGVGLQVHPQVGMGLAWSGVGLNLGVSVVPVPTIPLTIVAQGADLTDNSVGGTIFVLSVSYGFNFLPR
ncbi:hypothetical protein B6N60_02443 [Richelia sinica FACHB-800]|uniref:Uncharacterized protein n=2 Tax=Richelia TaxID=98443 RepID=A0A975T7U8_9NOST|nr:hypothetical protein [Richelia sinica FACHB-800]QXE23752.1 hypothetical protein B6N60_02443 [Richelia sinica FACHB-800]